MIAVLRGETGELRAAPGDIAQRKGWIVQGLKPGIIHARRHKYSQ